MAIGRFVLNVKMLTTALIGQGRKQKGKPLRLNKEKGRIDGAAFKSLTQESLMTDLMVSKNATMSSAEIATLVNKRHDNVKRTIETLAKSGVIQLPQITTVETRNNFGHMQMSKHYVFEGKKGRRDSTVCVAQLSPEFTAQLVDRWEELELAARLPQIEDSENIKDLRAKPVVVQPAVDPVLAEAMAFQKAFNIANRMANTMPGLSAADRYGLMQTVARKYLGEVTFNAPPAAEPPVFTPAEKKAAQKTTPANHSPMGGNETKVCNTCNTEKPVTEFRKDGDSYRGRCKPCHSAYEIARRAGK